MKVQIRDLSLNVLESGVGDPVLLFLHYWGGSARTWRRVIEPLLIRRRKAIHSLTWPMTLLP